ncbi:MAG TPA: ribosome-associated translation inhibitor RaiA [Bacteroidales bacterium]|nr:ribosome-associated translation inhibitor RaiA [Bacteroidales bacterium]
MNIKIHSVKFDADEKLLSFIEDKVNKLDQFYDGIIGTEVFLRLEKDTSGRENKIVEVKLDVAGKPLFSKRQCKTFEEATDQSVDAIRKQLIKRKEKIRSI